MSNWLCPKCNTYISMDHNRCSFCSNPRPGNPNEGVEKAAEHTEDKLKSHLHNIIEKMNHTTRRRLFYWLEDNIL